MRIKLSFLPPFPSSRILLLVPNDVKTITHLKKYLIKSLSSVAQHASSSHELLLEIEGFQLLSGSDLNIIEPTDVVW